ncbi:MAG: polyprenyl synthetase family protein [Desulfobacterales bacterium]|nr:polyprenyl synthetase family protein [Desulfobacterales bacterium]
MNDLKERLKRLTEKDLSEIEQEIINNLNPYLDLVKQISQHILFSGGKRLRPLLMVLSARLCNYQGQLDKTFSVIFEYLHAATLLHDDVIDGADLRRGKPVANKVWDNSMAILVGDFLLARSLAIAAESYDTRIIKIIAQITEDMSQGEIYQLMHKHNIHLSEEEYMQVIERKTASLIRGACCSGAILAKSPKEKEIALSEYGYHLGIAFQMADDLLDYTADTNLLGKNIGADIREGKITLPLIYTLKHVNESDRRMIQHMIKEPDFSEAEFTRLKELLIETGGIQYTRSKAVEHIQQAKAALSVFNESITRDTLLMISDYALERQL